MATSTGHVGAHPPLESRVDARSGAGPGGERSGVEAGRLVSRRGVCRGGSHPVVHRSDRRRAGRPGAMQGPPWPECRLHGPGL